MLLKNKPLSMINFSAKGTVPVLVLSAGRVIDESLDIMLWALQSSDPDQFLPNENSKEMEFARELIAENDSSFKGFLDRYKYSDRYLQYSQEYYREQGEVFLQVLDDVLKKNAFLAGSRLSFLDLAIAPFIRQFAYVDETWFFQSRYKNLILWLMTFLESDVFLSVMNKNSIWEDQDC